MNQSNDLFPNFDYEEFLRTIRGKFFVTRSGQNKVQEKVVPRPDIENHAFEVAIRLASLAVVFVAQKSNLDPFDLIKNLRFELNDMDFPNYVADPFRLLGFLNTNNILGLESHRIFVPASMTSEIIIGNRDYLVTFLIVVAHELEHLSQYKRAEDPNNPLNPGFSPKVYEELIRTYSNPDGYGPIDTQDMSDDQTNIVFHDTLINLGYYLYFHSPEEIGANQAMLSFLDYLIDNYDYIPLPKPSITIEYLIERRKMTQAFINLGQNPDDLFETLDYLLGSLDYLARNEKFKLTEPERGQLLFLANWLVTNPSPPVSTIPEDVSDHLEDYSLELMRFIDQYK